MRDALIHTRTRYVNVVSALTRRDGLRLPCGGPEHLDAKLAALPLPALLDAEVAPLRVLLGPLNSEIVAADAQLAGTRKAVLVLLTTVPLIIDDLGMRKLPHTAAEDLLEIIMRRYERTATVITSNKSFSQWGEILGDDVMATALIEVLAVAYGTQIWAGTCATERSATRRTGPGAPCNDFRGLQRLLTLAAPIRSFGLKQADPPIYLILLPRVPPAVRRPAV